MDTFYIVPSTSSSIILSSPTFLVDAPIIGPASIYSPVITVDPYAPYATYAPYAPYAPYTTYVSPVDNTIYSTLTSFFNPYYNNINYGIGESGLVRHNVNEYTRYKFLDHYLIKDYKNILAMLKIDNNMVVPVGENDKTIDPSTEFEENITKKIDYIGFNILTLTKNMKIIDKILKKNRTIGIYDLPHMTDYVASAQSKYVKDKIRKNRNNRSH